MLIDGLLNQTITSISSVTRDGYGRVVSTELYTNVKCRWQEKFTIILDKTGHEAVVKVQVWVKDTHNNEDVSIDVDYVFTYQSRTYTVVAYEHHYDIFGTVEYIKVYLR